LNDPEDSEPEKSETGLRFELPTFWEPRPYQLKLWRYLARGGLRADVAAHRRWGKDEVALNWASVASVARVGGYWHLLPEASQGRKAIWDAVNPHTGRRRIDEAFPHKLRAATRDADMMIRFRNGSTWQVCGSDNYNSLVGSPPVGVVFSEWALANAGGKKLQGLVNRRAAEVALWSTAEPGSLDRSPPSSATRSGETPPTPADPVPASRSGAILTAVTSAVAAVSVAAQQMIAAAAPFVEQSTWVRKATALLATAAAVAAVCVLALTWLKKREARA